MLSESQKDDSMPGTAALQGLRPSPRLNVGAPYDVASPFPHAGASLLPLWLASPSPVRALDLKHLKTS